jgi:hypothetical protein
MIFRTKYAFIVVAVLVLWGVALGVGRAWILKNPLKPVPANPAASRPSCAAAASKDRQAGFRAKHDLAANYWIKEQDLDWTTPTTGGVQKSDFIDHYSACPVHTGEMAIASEMSLLPKVEPASGHIVYPLHIEDLRVTQSVNAGAKIDVWDGNRLVTQDIVVLAVLCGPAGPTNNCVVLLDAATGDLSRIQSSNSQSIRIVLKGPKT